MKIRSIILSMTLAATATLGLAGAASARGSFGGGGGSSFHVPAPVSHAPAPASHSSSGSRGATAPKSTGSKSVTVKGKNGGSVTVHKSSGNSSNSNGSRHTTAPSGTGSKTVTKSKNSPNTGSISISHSTRASGSTYTVPGTNKTYTYNKTTVNHYYTTYHGGYPVYGSSLYWNLWNDPFYGPNYNSYGNPWYGNPYPVGYSLQNGQLVANQSSSSSTWLWVLLIILVVLAIAFSVWWYVFRSRKPKQTSFIDRA